MKDGDRSWTTAALGHDAQAALFEELPASRLWSLLLDVMARRAEQRTPHTLMEQWERDGFTRPTHIDQRILIELDAHLLAAAEDFEALELSPIAPLGTCSVVGLASQNKIVSALRGTEVVSDPSNVFALECARRLNRDPDAIVRLATTHHCVRAQELPKQPGFAPHFRMFCLSSAGREQKDHAFVVGELLKHVQTQLVALDRLEQHGYAFPDRRVTVLAAEDLAPLGDRIASAIHAAPVTREILRHPYYGGLRFMISARSTAGHAPPLIDGGAFDWVGKLTSNRRMVFVASAMGSQLAAHLFRPDASQG